MLIILKFSFILFYNFKNTFKFNIKLPKTKLI